MASVSDFEQGKPFTVEASGRQIPLELSVVNNIAAAPRKGGGFPLLASRERNP
ncbi:hypothetical protein LB559_31370 [Mesorhizobium sp. BR1-1-3]|uniref:hypothetical protein n=1 Tax=Mesorhizobium sp. BR1-1-3 TaxID=2876651 RepID=UPI001CD177BA|nr:hypothetical protein [Mesorhizobium sp. BR1-1-3]MBZ9892435.1 hypothetical protein [Mesorhizobium sp. BR1-1-3]